MTQIFLGVSYGPNGEEEVQVGTVEIGFAERMAMDHGLSIATARACKMGAFEIQDLVPHLPTLRPLIAEHGEHAVIERCQIARLNCGSAEQAIGAVAAFYAGKRGDVAGRAMTLAERQAAA